MEKEVSRAAYDWYLQRGKLAEVQKADPQYYAELLAVKKGDVRPSRPVSAEEWNRLHKGNNLSTIKAEDPAYYNALFAAKYGKSPEGASLESTTSTADEFYSLSLEQVLQAVKADAQGFLTKYRDRFKPLDYTRLLQLAKSIKQDSDYSVFVSEIRNAATATDPRNPHREHAPGQ